MHHEGSYTLMQDHMRKAGEVSFAQVFREAGGENVKYRHYDFSTLFY